MFVLNRDLFHDVDFDRTSQFVECWERYYGDEDHEYLASLNIGSDLTEENVVRLLRWRDSRRLTHPNKDGEPNPRVTRVLEQLGTLNAFRNGTISADDLQEVTGNIFPHGIIWQLFLFHIASPADWPIADQHVFRAYSVLFDTAICRHPQYYRNSARCRSQFSGGHGLPAADSN